MPVRLLVPLLLASLLLPLEVAGAQAAAPYFASAFLDPDHWAARAARRIQTLGLTPRETGWPDASLTRREVGVMLRAAARHASHRSAEHASLARSLWERFAEEFPATAARLRGDPAIGRLRGEGLLTAGLEARDGRYVPGFAAWIQHGGTGPIPLPSRSDAAGAVTWAASPTSILALELSPTRARGDWNTSEGYALLRLRGAGLWLGRRSLGYGPGAGGGLILNARAAFTGGGITLGAGRLPWLFRHLGPMRFEGFLSRIDSSFAVKDPWVMVNHASMSPHPRLLLGITHGAIFAGSGRPPFTARNFLAMVTLGRATKGSAEEEFENQLVAGEIRWIPPVGALPLELHLAWGTEDNQGAWYQVPATQFGARIAAVPGVPALSVGLERTEFEPPSPESGDKGFHSNWYRHYIYKAGWTVDQRLLGHPLGGNGVEWLAHGHADLLDARLRIDARAYYRERQTYNLFAPELKGFGHGGSLAAAWRFRGGLEALGSVELERLGNDEIRSVLFVGGRAVF